MVNQIVEDGLSAREIPFKKDLNGWYWIDIDGVEVGIDGNNLSDWWRDRLIITPLHRVI